MPGTRPPLCAAWIAALALSLPALPVHAAGGPGPAPQVFAALDTDGDGRITRTELDARRAAMFARIDANGDGALDSEEITAARTRLAERAERVARAARAGTGSAAMRADRDGDGRVTLAEFTARAPLFALLDADGDGALDRAEFDRAAAILRN